MFDLKLTIEIENCVLFYIIISVANHGPSIFHDRAGFPPVTAPHSDWSGPSNQESVVEIVLIYKTVC
jgi:hypothetical protein